MASRDITEPRVGETNGSERARQRCPECDGRLREATYETRCVECGLVVAEDLLDRGPDWKMVEGDGAPRRRTGRALTETLHDRGLSTVIGLDPVDAGRKRRQLRRLRREHDRALFSTKAERNLAHALGEIARLTSALDLPRCVRERASVLYRRAQREGLIRGRSIESVASGSVYAACRCVGVMRTLEEVAEVAQCPSEKVELGYDVLNRELGLATPVTRPRAYVPRLVSAVDASCGLGLQCDGGLEPACSRYREHARSLDVHTRESASPWPEQAVEGLLDELWGFTLPKIAERSGGREPNVSRVMEVCAE